MLRLKKGDNSKWIAVAKYINYCELYNFKNFLYTLHFFQIKSSFPHFCWILAFLMLPLIWVDGFLSDDSLLTAKCINFSVSFHGLIQGLIGLLVSLNIPYFLQFWTLLFWNPFILDPFYFGTLLFWNPFILELFYFGTL